MFTIPSKAEKNFTQNPRVYYWCSRYTIPTLFSSTKDFQNRVAVANTIKPYLQKQTQKKTDCCASVFVLLISLFFPLSKEERFAFLTEWYDSTAALQRRYQLMYYPKDGSVEMVDISWRRVPASLSFL